MASTSIVCIFVKTLAKAGKHVSIVKNGFIFAYILLSRTLFVYPSFLPGSLQASRSLYAATDNCPTSSPAFIMYPAGHHAATTGAWWPQEPLG